MYPERTELFRDREREWGERREAAITVIPLGGGSETGPFTNHVYFAVETEKGHSDGPEYRAEKHSACSSFTVDEFLEELKTEWDPKKKINWVLIGRRYAPDGNCVGFDIDNGTIRKMHVKRLSFNMEENAEAFFAKIAAFGSGS